MLNAVLNPEGITTLGLASSRFARRYFGNLFWFLFLRLLRCFSSAGLPTYTYEFSIGWQGIALPGFPIRKSADLCLFAAPRGLSQLVTSFFGSWCQGILHVLFFAWPRHSSPLRSFAYANFTLFGGCSSSQKISSTTPFFGSPTHLIPISAGFRLSVPCKVKRSLVLLSDSQLCE